MKHRGGGVGALETSCRCRERHGLEWRSPGRLHEPRRVRGLGRPRRCPKPTHMCGAHMYPSHGMEWACGLKRALDWLERTLDWLERLARRLRLERLERLARRLRLERLARRRRLERLARRRRLERLARRRRLEGIGVQETRDL
ncbi:hypothetical protein DPX16_16004 [Anabarilius grahami]|uniref:Uncharacterized protein n=1 Tax=Anabarilius grahami TaxID=495550 RepID=A0A3N0YVE2_ANAGA|nr:hypothetical protein DPX16_16004 [Anabarilius grahami]